MNKIILGSQVSMCAPKYLRGVIEQILLFGGNAMMFLIGNPRKFKQLEIEKLDKNLFHDLLKKNNLDIDNVFIHCSYLINFGNLNEKVFKTGIEILENICRNAKYIGVKNLILHPGSSLEFDRKKSLESVVKGIDFIISKFTNINIHLEMMSGRGSEIGFRFEEMNFILNKSKYSNNIFVCWDTCHMFASGYDIKNNLDEVINIFDKIIGLNKLKVLHLNDSLKPFGSKKDRHANIGEGFIGTEALKKIVHHPKLKKVVKLLETPYLNNKPQYNKEIELLK